MPALLRGSIMRPSKVDGGMACRQAKGISLLHRHRTLRDVPVPQETFRTLLPMLTCGAASETGHNRAIVH